MALEGPSLFYNHFAEQKAEINNQQLKLPKKIKTNTPRVRYETEDLAGINNSNPPSAVVINCSFSKSISRVVSASDPPGDKDINARSHFPLAPFPSSSRVDPCHTHFQSR